MFGHRDGTSGQYNSPVDLEVNGVLDTYGFFEVLPGGDNPDVTDWICEKRYVALLYGCTTNVAGCLCAANQCPDNALYIFDTDGCCCFYPCGEIARECTWSTDHGSTMSAPTAANHEITSFVMDGVEYLPGTVTLFPPNIINIGGFNYNTALADTINSIGVPYFTAEYPTQAEIQSAHAQGSGIFIRNNIIRFKYPVCFNFTIQANGEGDNYTWTQSAYSGQNVGTQYAFAAPIDCVDTNEC